jgi:pyruvate/2-oxoglutarate dehydrogenase complex dihydrolipoamide dehydrogenase (E3) component
MSTTSTGELDVGLNKEDEEGHEGHNNAEDHEDAMFDNGGVPSLLVIDPEIQPVDLTEEEVLELAITQSMLDELDQWRTPR